MNAKNIYIYIFQKLLSLLYHPNIYGKTNLTQTSWMNSRKLRAILLFDVMKEYNVQMDPRIDFDVYHVIT